MTPTEIRQARIEGAAQHLLAKLVTVDGGSDVLEAISESAVDLRWIAEQALAAADAVAQPIVWTAECSGCGGSGCGGHYAKCHGECAYPCESCHGKGRVWVLADCPTCEGDMTVWTDEELGIEDDCPDCSDGSVRRLLLEQMGGQRGCLGGGGGDR